MFTIDWCLILKENNKSKVVVIEHPADLKTGHFQEGGYDENIESQNHWLRG